MRNVESFTIGVIEFTIEAFHQECFIKLRQPSPNVPLSCKSQGSTSNQYFIIKDVDPTWVSKTLFYVH